MNNWDKYFYELCKTVAKNSKCMSRQIGTVLVRDKSIISTGYNGPPRGMPHCNERHKIDDDFWSRIKLSLLNEMNEENIPIIKVGSERKIDWKKIRQLGLKRCPRQILGFKSGEGLDSCVAGHAERNSLINAARNGISTKGATLYMSCGIPCGDCLIEIINAGVLEIVVSSFDWYDEKSKYLLKNSDLKVRTFDL